MQPCDFGAKGHLANSSSDSDNISQRLTKISALCCCIRVTFHRSSIPISGSNVWKSRSRPMCSSEQSLAGTPKTMATFRRQTRSFNHKLLHCLQFDSSNYETLLPTFGLCIRFITTLLGRYFQTHAFTLLSFRGRNSTKTPGALRHVTEALLISGNDN